MGQEIELKLELPGRASFNPASVSVLRDLCNGREERENLTSVYFDTRTQKLRGNGLALRIRRIGARRVQTIKAIQKGGRGPLGRDEWEEEVDTDTPDLSLAKGTALARFAGKRLRRKLRPVFETVVERLTLPIRSGASDIEVALDRGWVKAGRHRDAINELELELKSGELADLTTIAERLVGTLPLVYVPRSKQDRGYALVAGEKASVVGAAPIALASGSSAGDAFRGVALACLDHALSNTNAVRAGDTEGVHQMRVGLRRLRAALSLFRPLIEGAETDAIKAELKWLTEQLAPARDFDVFIDEGVLPLGRDGPASEISVLTMDLRSKREHGLDRAKTTMDSDRFRSLGLQTALWILSGGPRNGDGMPLAPNARPVADLAAESLARWTKKKIIRKARRVDRLDSCDRHKLRIAVKKLRYAVDFFGGVFGHKRRRSRFTKQLKALQSALGRLNDIEVHKRVADTIVHHERSPRRIEKAFAAGFISGYEHTQIKRCVADTAKAGKLLAEISPFWDQHEH